MNELIVDSGQITEEEVAAKKRQEKLDREIMKLSDELMK